MFRSVEGQAASDEEEDKWTGEQQRQVDEVRRILSRLSCCEERYSTAPRHKHQDLRRTGLGRVQIQLRKTRLEPLQNKLRTR